MQHPQEEGRKECAHLNKKSEPTTKPGEDAGAVRPRARLRQGRKPTPVSGYTEWLTLASRREQRNSSEHVSQGHARHARLSWIQTTSRTVDKRRLSRKPTVGKGSSMQTVTERHPTEQTRLYKVTRLKKKATCQQETRNSQQGYQSRTLAVKTCDAKPAVRRETAPQHSGTRRLPAPPPLQNLTRPGPDLRMLATNITQTTWDGGRNPYRK